MPDSGSDGAQAPPVATYASSSFWKGTKATLEVDGAIIHILDLVVLTWIYVEKLRRQSQQNNAAAASAAASASSASAAASC